jgi:hypothetical protein
VQLPVPHTLLHGDTLYYVRLKVYDVYLEPSQWSTTTEFTTSANNNDVNQNGIPDNQEVGVGVDLDENGVDDIDESDRIKSVQSDGGTVSLGIAKDSDNITDIEALEIIDPATISDTNNSPTAVTHGLFSYRLTVNDIGATAYVKVYFSEAIPSNILCFKYDRINGWVDYSQHTTFNGDGRSITLEVKDGGFGDSDGEANGVIVDPGALGVGGSEGGNSNVVEGFLNPVEAACFIDTSAQGDRNTASSGLLLPVGVLFTVCLRHILKKMQKGTN